MKELIASCSVALDLEVGKVPGWVKLVPVGRFIGRDGRKYNMTDPAGVIARTLAHQSGADLPFDYDHQLLFAQKNGQPAIASGWIKEIQTRVDGIWGMVEWTLAAAERIAAKEYRYVSPMFTHDAAGNVLRLAGAGLTNMPNLTELPAIASQDNPEQESGMDIVKLLALALGLSESTGQEALVAHAQKLQNGFRAFARAIGLAETANPEQVAAHAQDLMGKLAAAFKLASNASPEQIVAHAQQIATGAPDPSQYVAMSQYTAVADQLKTLQAAQVAGLVDDAVKAGKLIPAQREWGIAYASQNLDGFKKFVENQPVIVAGGAELGQQPGKEVKAGDLTKEQMAICSQMGLTAEAFKKASETLKSQEA